MKTKSQLKDKTVSFRCTEEEKDLLHQQASESNMSFGDYIIENCLKKNRRIDIKGLCRIQTLLNKLKKKEISKKEFISNMEFILGEMKWL